MSHFASCLKQNTSAFFEFSSAQGILRKSFADVYADVSVVRARLISLGLRAGSRVGILCENNYYFVLSDLACLLSGHRSFAFHAKLMGGNISGLMSKYLLDLLVTERNFVVAEHSQAVMVLTDEVIGARPSDLTSEVTAQGAVYDFKDEEIVTEIFTSGTTGWPKGIAVRYECIADFLSTTGECAKIDRNDSFLIFLPMSQFTSRCYVYSAITAGINVCITDPSRVSQVMRTFKPTILQGVPVFFETIGDMIYERIHAGAAGARAYRLCCLLRTCLPARFRWWLARCLFKDVHAVFGGQTRVMITGSAPIRKGTLELYDALGLPLYEAYGSNETGLISVNTPDDNRLGSVGKVIPNKNIYFGSDGEIRVAGKYCWKERYCGGEDFFATGDLGYLDADNYLYVCGRRDERLTLSSGVKVNPAEVERMLNDLPFVRQSMISTNSSGELVCFAVIKQDGPSPGAICFDIVTMCREINWELNVVNVITDTQRWSPDNGLLTQSMKLNRSAIAEKYRVQLQNG